jgi:arsenate reductase
VTVIWHNPRCAKSRRALALLEGRGAAVTVRRYLDDPPTLAELEAAQAALGLPAARMVRPCEPRFKALGLSLADGDAALLRAMADNPKLIERPVVFAGGRAVIARPPELVEELA